MVDKWKSCYARLPIQARASLWFLLCSVLQKGISTITTPVFTRILTPGEYGQFSVYSSWERIISVIVSMNLTYGVLTQGLVRFEDKKNQYTSSLMGLSTVLIAVWFLLYLLFQSFWNRVLSLPTAQMTAMFASIWASSCCSFWMTRERVDYRYQKMAVVTLSMSVVRPVLEFILITNFGDRVTARIVGDAALSLSVYTCFFLILLRRGGTFYDRACWKYAFLFNLPLIPHYLSQVVLSGSDRIMIHNLIGASEAGMYNLAYTVSTVMTIFNSSLNSTMEPWMYRKIRDGKPEEISPVTYPLFILVAGLNILTILFAPEIIAIFAPPAYYDAIWIIPPVAMSVFFQFTYVFFGVFEFYFQKTYLVSAATLIGALANIALNYIFIRIFGYYAAGYTTLFCYMLFSAAHYIFMKRIVRNQYGKINVYPFRQFLLIVLVFCVCGFSILFTYKYIILRYSLAVIMFGIIFTRRNHIAKTYREIAETKGG